MLAIRSYVEFCSCPECGAVHNGAPSQIHARFVFDDNGIKVMRRQCARCGAVWAEDLNGYQVVDMKEVADAIHGQPPAEGEG